MGNYRGYRAIFGEAGFERGARAWLARWGGVGRAISCVAVVSSVEAAALAAVRLPTLLTSSEWDLPPDLLAKLPRYESVHSEIALAGLPHGGGMRTTSVRIDTGARSHVTITGFADDRLVYFLWTAEHTHAASLTDAQIAASMEALYERVQGRPLPAGSRPRRPAPAPDRHAGPPSLLWQRELGVASDYGQIYIYDRATVFEEVENPLQEALADAHESGRYVGVADGLVDLVTPGLERRHRHAHRGLVERAARRPRRLAAPGGRRPAAALGGDRVRGLGRRRHFDEATVPAGNYRARISGRGFTQAGLAGAESYRIQLWPAEAPEAPVLRQGLARMVDSGLRRSSARKAAVHVPGLRSAGSNRSDRSGASQSAATARKWRSSSVSTSRVR